MSKADLSEKNSEEKIEYLINEVNSREAEVAELRQELADAKETIEEFKRMIFASRSEKKHVGFDDPNQLTLMDIFNEAEFASDSSVEEIPIKQAVEGYLRKKADDKKKKSTYEEMFDSLPSRELRCSVAPEDRVCPDCGAEMERIGWDYVRTELEIIPAQVRKVVIYQEKVACRKCAEKFGEAYFVEAEIPSVLIPKSFASPTTVAYVMYEKYINSMPLYRQEKALLQMGVKISRTTLANWCIYCGLKYFKPVYQAMVGHLLERNCTAGDETPCQVLKEDGRTAQQKSYMWIHCTTNLDGLPPIMLYEYNPSRSGSIPENFYKEYKGKYVIVDGYQGYNKLPKGTVRCGCLAHFRRKFYDALPAADRKAGKSKSPAALIVNLCDKIFEIERGFTGLTPAERKIQREKSKEREIWKMIWTALDNISASSGSQLGKALTYARNQKPYMENYFLDGGVPVSNNFTESCGARPYAVGRKNFYFHDTPDGAEASSIIYSLAQTAKLNNISVFKYLQTVLLYMPDYVNEPEGIEELMPWSDKMQRLCAINKKATVEDESGNPALFV